MADIQENTISRLNFFKIAGLLGGSALLASCVERISLGYLELCHGDKFLFIPPEGKDFEEITIKYTHPDSRSMGTLYVRMEDNKPYLGPGLDPNIPKKYKKGEILDYKIYRLEKSGKLDEEVTIGEYPYPWAPMVIDDRKDAPEKTYGIKVAVVPSDYLKDGQLKVVQEPNGNLHDITGEGYAIGTYISEKKEFIVSGFVGDSRAYDISE